MLILYFRIEQANTLATVESLLTSSPTIPFLLIRKITMLSIADLVASDAAARHGHLRRVLSLVQQRHPSIFQDASKSYMDNESTRAAVEQIVLSLSVVRHFFPVDKDSLLNPLISLILARKRLIKFAMLTWSLPPPMQTLKSAQSVYGTCSMR